MSRMKEWVLSILITAALTAALLSIGKYFIDSTQLTQETGNPRITSVVSNDDWNYADPADNPLFAPGSSINALNGLILK